MMPKTLADTCQSIDYLERYFLFCFQVWRTWDLTVFGFGLICDFVYSLFAMISFISFLLYLVPF